jgi:hypothetical protein
MDSISFATLAGRLLTSFDNKVPGAKSNRYEYFGNGWTEKEKRNDQDETTNYLRKVGPYDLATLHEACND